MYGSVGSGIAIAADDGLVSVRLDRKGCGECGLGCNTGETIIAYNQCNAKTGEVVSLIEDESFVMRILFVQFSIPLIGFVGGTAGAWYLFEHEIAAIAVGFIATFFSGWIVRKYLRKIKPSRPVFIAVSRS